MPVNEIENSNYGLGGRFDRTLKPQVQPTFPFGSDEYWMEQALLISMNSIGLSPPNPAVGCVLVQNQKMVSSGFTQRFGHEHAERMAFQNLDPSLTFPNDLKDLTAYVTLEPCSHFGSQPPCVDLLLNSKIKRVVIATIDPDERVSGQGIQKLKAAGIDVKLNVLQRESRLWNFPFLKSKETRKPVWIGKWAQTQSGHLADHQGNSQWISNEKSRAYTHWLRQKYDAIVVGAQTFLQDQPKLTSRDGADPHNRNPKPFVFDPKGLLLGKKLPETFQALVCESELTQSATVPDGVIVIEGDPKSPHLVERFQKAIESQSFERPLQSIMVEGGPHLLNSFLKEDRFDALHIFTGKKVFDLTSPRHQVSFNLGQNWNYASRHHFDDDLLHEWVKAF